MTTSLLLATTGRPLMARRAVETAIAGADTPLEIVAAVDDDLDTFNEMEALDAVISYEHEPRGCSRAWNDALRLARGDNLVLAADDLVFEDGWLDAALAALAAHPGYLIGFNDGHHGPELSTHYLMPRAFVVEVLGGVVAWEDYGHGYNDREANARARAAGRYVWAEDARVRHEHWTFGQRACDDTDTRNLARLAESEANFHRRAAEGFPNDEAPVLDCPYCAPDERCSFHLDGYGPTKTAPGSGAVRAGGGGGR